MEIKSRKIQHTFRNKYLKYGGTSASYSLSNSTSSSSGNIINKWFYEDEDGNLHSKLNFIGDSEISAYGAGNSDSAGNVTIIDSLTSIATDCALSANMGRVLKELIDNTDGGGTLSKLIDVSLGTLADGQILKYNATTGKWTNGTGINVTWATIEGKPTGLTNDNIALWTDAANKRHEHSNKLVLDGITNAKITNWDTVVTNWNKAFYFDANGSLKVKVNLVGEQEVSAYGTGNSPSGGAITIIDALTSTATDAALSANQGRVLKNLIDSNSGGVSSWNDLLDKPSTFIPSAHVHTIADVTNLSTLLDGKAAAVHTHTIASITDLQSTLDGKVNTSTVTAHTSNTTVHITAAERINWNKAYTNNHTHSNKSVIDGITSTKITNWDGVVNNWNKAFYYDNSNNLRVKLNLVGEGDISAYGAGSISGSGVVTIVDNLTSIAADCALSANQGRILKGLIDTSIGGVSSWNDLTDKPITFAPAPHTHNYTSAVKLGTVSYNVTSNTISLPAYPTTLPASDVSAWAKAASKPTYLWNEIGSKPSTFTPAAHTHTIANVTSLQTTLDGKAAASHTHNYTSTVKIGSTAYNVASNVIGLPAYPTIPTSLKNPNALTISLNGSSQGAYDGSAAKSINITAANVGAAAASHTHNYITSRGNLSPQTGRTQNLGDVYSYNTVAGATSTAAPATYTSVIGFGRGVSGSVEICGGWTSGMGLWYRALRDTTDNWFGWRKLLDSTNYTDYTTNKTGSGASGTWGISITGNAASANKVNSTLSFAAGVFAAKSFNGSTAQTVNIPTHTSHITNNSGYITTAATVASANKLTTARTINGTSFNGTANITTANWGTARTLTLAGAVTGSVSINGGSNVTLTTTANHTHTIANITNLQTTLNSKLDKSVWDKAFYFDSSNNLKVKLNLIGEKEVSAYGAGTTGGVGAVTIVDALTSTATNAALSANQGRVLKSLIDGKTVNLSNYYTKSEVDSKIIIRGTLDVNGSGSIVRRVNLGNCSSAWRSAGTYRITHNLGTSNYNVLLTAMTNGNLTTALIENKGTNYFEYTTTSYNGSIWYKLNAQVHILITQ